MEDIKDGYVYHSSFNIESFEDKVEHIIYLTEEKLRNREEMMRPLEHLRNKIKDAKLKLHKMEKKKQYELE
jgi:hypothetical protein